MAEVLSAFSHAPLRSSASHTSFFESPSGGGLRKNSSSHADLRSAALLAPKKNKDSRLSLNTKFSFGGDDSDSDDDELLFPAYASGVAHSTAEENEAPPSSPVTAHRTPTSPTEGTDSNSTSATTPLHSEDDSAVRAEPSRHVDYLSYEWKEEDIWSSWRHIVEHRRVYGERSRLENASWRTWAKSQFNLRTVSPETLNWSKDCDVTWLYGPLQPATNRNPNSQNASEPVSRLSKSNSFIHKKPILKKRTMSEVMLQKSISASSLVKQAAAAVQAQQRAATPRGTPMERRRRPVVGQVDSYFMLPSVSTRTTSTDATDYFSSQSSSGLQTPEHGERKHIRFDDKVEQCIAVDCSKDGDDDDDYANNWATNNDSSDDEGVVMMKRSRKKRTLSRSSSKTSVAGESKTIAKLPDTTLKYRTDSPDVTEQHLGHSLFGFYRSSRLSPSPSQETLRPSNPSSNFLLADHDDGDDEPWEPAGAFEVKQPGTPTPQNQNLQTPESGSAEAGSLRRTASGMFMPFEDEDENAEEAGIIGRVVDTVNTARDIAHVIWNVGWRN